MEDFKGMFGKITKTIGKSSGDFVKTTKLTLNLSSEEEKLKQIYYDIGKKVHEIYAYGGSIGKFFDEKYLEIKAQEEKIHEIQTNLDMLKGTATCPNCNAVVSGGADFCAKCGANLKRPIVESEIKDYNTIEAKEKMTQEIGQTEQNTISPEKPPSPPITEETNLCRVCGAVNHKDDKFCFSCGRML